MRGANFWLDRAKTAAIAKHTNAFKINEDVVIPLERLGEYTRMPSSAINIELSIRNKLELLAALEEYFAGESGSGGASRGASGVAADADAARTSEARDLILSIRARWQYLLDNMDDAESDSGSVFDRLQDGVFGSAGKPRCGRRWRAYLWAAPSRRCSSIAMPSTSVSCMAAYSSRCTMHAGDGNVHTNIPVNSDDYAMLHTANARVARIMRIARA